MERMTGRTLKEIAYERIRRGIVHGEWSGGTFLSEKWLSELLGMSKTPIRSALDRLEMTGLVKHIPNQGVLIQEVSLQKIMEIYELRHSLETYAARVLTGKLDRSLLARLDANLEAQAQAADHGDIAGYVELDRQFHECIVSGLGNEEYAEVMSRLQDKFVLAVRTTFVRSSWRLAGSLAEHRDIRAALAGDDPQHTERLMARHIEYVKQVML